MHLFYVPTLQGNKFKYLTIIKGSFKKKSFKVAAKETIKSSEA
jgi:hypothetical protein